MNKEEYLAKFGTGPTAFAMRAIAEDAWDAAIAAHIAAPADLLRRLLDDHQRVEPHHAHQCALCREAQAAIDGRPAQGERKPTLHEMIVMLEKLALSAHPDDKAGWHDAISVLRQANNA